MTDLEISKELALAIGWKADRVLPNEYRYNHLQDCWVYHNNNWRLFDYRDWNVIGPIAERYKLEVDFGLCGAMHQSTFIWYYRDTVQEAIAACVIGAKK